MMNSLFSRSRALGVLLAALFCAACGVAGGSYRVDTSRMGALYPSKGASCAVAFQNLNFQEASSKYESLGLITVSNASSDEFTEPMKKDVERAACKMGADVVSLNVGGHNAFQFLAWRHRT